MDRMTEKHDPSLWLEWAVKSGIDPILIAFVRYRPDALVLYHRPEDTEEYREFAKLYNLLPPIEEVLPS